MLDLRTLDGLVEVFDRSQYRHVAPTHLGHRAGVLIEEANRHQSVLWMSLQASCDLRPHDARTEDQHGLSDEPVGSCPALSEREAYATEADSQKGEEPTAQPVGGVGDPAVDEHAKHSHRHRCHRHAADDRGDAVQHERPQADPVQAAQVEEHEHEHRHGEQRSAPGRDVQGVMHTAKRHDHRRREEREVGHRPNDPPARALERPLKPTRKDSPPESSRHGGVMTQLSATRERGRGLLGDLWAVHEGRFGSF